jgi:hypothetical protein
MHSAESRIEDVWDRRHTTHRYTPRSSVFKAERNRSEPHLQHVKIHIADTMMRRMPSCWVGC